MNAEKENLRPKFMHNFADFICSVASHWAALVSGVLAFLLGMWEKHRSKQFTHYSLWVFSFGCLFLACYLAWVEQHDLFLKEQAKAGADYISEHRPYLSPSLSIDNIDSNNIQYHFEIENNGLLPAGNIYENLSSSVVEMTENSLPLNRTIDPRSHMSMTPPPSSLPMDSYGANITLALSYQALIHGSNYTFRSEFHFNIPKYELKTGKFNYESDNPGMAGQEDKDMQQMLAKISEPSGTAFLTLPPQTNGQPFQFHTPVRSLRACP